MHNYYRLYSYIPNACMFYLNSVSIFIGLEKCFLIDWLVQKECNSQLMIVWCLTPFSIYFSYITTAIVPIHAFQWLNFPARRIIFFPNYLLISHMAVVKTVDSGKRGMNLVMTIINSRMEH